MNGFERTLEWFANNVFNEVAILIGIIVLVGLLLQKKRFEEILSGAVRATVGVYAMFIGIAVFVGGLSAFQAITASAFGKKPPTSGVTLDKFMADNPGTTVNVTPVDWGQAVAKLQTAIGGKQTPDISQMGTDMMGQFATTGALEPGTALPSLRDAARRWGVNLHTVRHAYASLAAQGLVRTEAPHGTVVLGRRAPKPAALDRGEADRFLARMLAMYKEHVLGEKPTPGMVPLSAIAPAAPKPENSEAVGSFGD